MGRVVELKFGAVALADPLEAVCSDGTIVVSLGMEFVVEERGVSPEWSEGRAALTGPLLAEGLAEVMRGSLYCGEVIAERMSSPPMGISPDVGVGREYPGEVAMLDPAPGESLDRSSVWVAGES